MNIHNLQDYFTKNIYPLYKDLKHYVYTLCGDKYLADDVASDIMLMAWSKLCYIKSRRDPKAYLLKCAKNRMIDCLRKQGHVVYLVKPELVYTEPEVADVIFRLIRQEDIHSMLSAIQMLTDQERRIILMYYVYGESMVDIADLSRMNYNTVAALKRRALEKLAAAMDRIISLLKDKTRRFRRAVLRVVNLIGDKVE